MIANIASATVRGAHGHPVTVEVHVGAGLPGFTMLGLPDEACREARDRVRAAVLSSGFDWPDRRITVNLAPPHHRKTGSGLDLAIAIGVLVAAQRIPPEAVGGLHMVGEVGLDGALHPVPGVAPMVAVDRGADWVVPVGSLAEASAVGRSRVLGATCLAGVVEALTGTAEWADCDAGESDTAVVDAPDMRDVRGQPVARAALEVAAAGGHHLLLVGSPGSGKTMLAERLCGLLPDLTADVALEATMIHSAAGERLPTGGLVRRPPFRTPHHSATLAAMVGGGSHHLRPGAASLAHGGVLFCDEMGQFAPSVLDGLREALECGAVTIGRVEHQVTVPARFQMIGATNPCPCGEGLRPGSCICDERARRRYSQRLSGPLLDRFDLRVAVQRPDTDHLLGGSDGECSAVIAGRVEVARTAALQRAGVLNAHLDAVGLDRHARPDADGAARLRTEIDAGRLTGRGYHRVRRTARTLADLVGEVGDVIDDRHVATAVAMRVSMGAERGRG